MRRLKTKVRNRLWTMLKARWKLNSGLQVVVENDSDWFVFNEIFTNQEYDSALSLLMKARQQGLLILDLGANVGYFSLKVADDLLQAGRTDFRIIALEASPNNYRMLSPRMEQPLLKGKVSAILGLAGHRVGSHAILHSQQHYGHSAIADKKDVRAVVVDYVDIDGLIGDDHSRIDFLKCDIEGSEEIFISEYATLLKRVENAVFEFHAGECDVDRCRQLLEAAGLMSKGIVRRNANYQTTVEIFSRH